MYGVGRFWIEGLRVDPADEIGPFRWNQWVALAAIVVGVGLFFVLRNRPDVEPNVDPVLDPDVDGLLADEADVTDDVDERPTSAESASDKSTSDELSDDEEAVSAGVADDELDGQDDR